MTDSVKERTGPLLEVAGVERIAVFRALHLGDFLCAVPALRALKDRYPEAEVTLIGLPWTREIVDRYPCVDRFLEFPGYWGLEGVPWEPDGTRSFLEAARDHGYDLALQMHGDGRISNGFVAQLGARATLGYRPGGVRPGRKLDLELSGGESVHEIFRWLRLVGAVGAEGGPHLEFPLRDADWIEAEIVGKRVGLGLGRPTIAVHPGAGDPAKLWPVERFAEVADRLALALDAQVLITGSRSEVPLARQVAEKMRVGAFNVAGRTTVGGLAALLSRARLLLSNDTGPAHLAAAIATPTVILFGPTDPARWAPLDDRAHRALWSGQDVPITDISADQVVEESLTLVEKCAYLTF